MRLRRQVCVSGGGCCDKRHTSVSTSAGAHVSQAAPLWAGELFARGGYAQVGTRLQPEDAEMLRGCEGLLLRVAGDGKAWSVLLTTGAGPRAGVYAPLQLFAPS